MPRARAARTVARMTRGAPACAPGAGAIRTAGLRADADAARTRRAHGRAHDEGVAGVRAAGDARRGDEREHVVGAGDAPAPEALAEVGVEIDDRHAYESARGRA